MNRLKAHLLALSQTASAFALVLAPLHFQNMTQLSLTKANKSKVSGLYNVAGMSGGVVGSLTGGLLSKVAPLQSIYLLWLPVLLLDEPFGALDALTRVHLQEELRALRRRTNATVLMVTHDVEEALFLSDRVVVFQPRPGRIVQTVTVGAHDRGGPAFARQKEEILAGLMAAPKSAPVALEFARRRPGG